MKEGRFLAACWLHPQAFHGLPPLSDASLRIIKLGCLGLEGRAGHHTGGLAIYRQHLCDLLEVLFRHRLIKPTAYRPLCLSTLLATTPGHGPNGLITDYTLTEVDYSYPTLVVNTCSLCCVVYYSTWKRGNGSVGALSIIQHKKNVNIESGQIDP